MSFDLPQCWTSNDIGSVNSQILGLHRSQKIGLTGCVLSGNSYWPDTEAFMSIMHWSIPGGKQSLGIPSFKPYPSQMKFCGALVTINVVSAHTSTPRNPGRYNNINFYVLLEVLNTPLSWAKHIDTFVSSFCNSSPRLSIFSESSSIPDSIIIWGPLEQWYYIPSSNLLFCMQLWGNCGVTVIWRSWIFW